MRIDEAVRILRAHNKWRRGDDTMDDSPMPAPMESPREIGVAIDVVCDYVERSEGLPVISS